MVRDPVEDDRWGGPSGLLTSGSADLFEIFIGGVYMAGASDGSEDAPVLYAHKHCSGLWRDNICLPAGDYHGTLGRVLSSGLESEAAAVLERCCLDEPPEGRVAIADPGRARRCPRAPDAEGQRVVPADGKLPSQWIRGCLEKRLQGKAWPELVARRLCIQPFGVCMSLHLADRRAATPFHPEPEGLHPGQGGNPDVGCPADPLDLPRLHLTKYTKTGASAASKIVVGPTRRRIPSSRGMNATRG
mmetsp:Transcript_42329/g.100421  ORF Transcript_42329/g.100421 Transcript_42329/m.100421 type:complete len:245 (-) Transcript_42329:3157-3891(-)